MLVYRGVLLGTHPPRGVVQSFVLYPLGGLYTRSYTGKGLPARTPCARTYVRVYRSILTKKRRPPAYLVMASTCSFFWQLLR